MPNCASAPIQALVDYPFAAFDIVSDELLASIAIEGPQDGEGVLQFAAFGLHELFDRPFYLTAGEPAVYPA